MTEPTNRAVDCLHPNGTVKRYRQVKEETPKPKRKKPVKKKSDVNVKSD